MLNKVQIAGLVAIGLGIAKIWVPALPAGEGVASTIAELIMAAVPGAAAMGAAYAVKESADKLRKLKLKAR